MKLAIGTVQFGLNYGVANSSGRVPLLEVRRILDIGRANDVDTLDTAIAYGDSERVLGAIGMEGWRIITKLPAMPIVCEDVEAWIRKQVDFSMARLGVKAVHGLLLHDAADLLGRKGSVIARVLGDLKQSGLVAKTGFSIYSPTSLMQLVRVHIPDIVQAPLNVVDRRLVESGWLQRLVDLGVEVHVRSVFMQGLLLMGNAQRPAYFARWKGLWDDWTEYLATSGADALSVCLGFVKSNHSISQVVVGVDNSYHFSQLVKAFRNQECSVPLTLSRSDSDLIDPVNWKTK